VVKQRHIMVGDVGRSLRGVRALVEEIHTFVAKYKQDYPVPYECREITTVDVAFTAPRSEGVLKHGVFCTLPGSKNGLVVIVVFSDTPDWLLSHLIVHEISHAYCDPLENDRHLDYLERPSETWCFAVADAWLLHKYGQSYWELWNRWTQEITPEGVKAYRSRIESVEVVVKA